MATGGPGLADADSLLGTALPAHARGHGTIRVAAIFLVLWLAPVAVLLLLLGPDQVFTRLALFFSQMAIVTFGGAYAVLAYVAQAAAETYMWVTPGEMLDGLGMAETTPGPLIMVVQFVGFLAAFRDPGSLDPYLAAVLASVLVTWVTFTPSFLWIFLGAPYIERLRHNRALAGALAAITAAVVGVILNLAIWFGLHVLFRELVPMRAFGLRIDVPVLSSIDLASLALFLGGNGCHVSVPRRRPTASCGGCAPRMPVGGVHHLGRSSGRTGTICPTRSSQAGNLLERGGSNDHLQHEAAALLDMFEHFYQMDYGAKAGT